MPGDQPSAGEHVALRFDGSNRPGVAYRKSDALGHHLRYALWDAGIWQYSVPDARPGMGLYPDLAFEADDEITPIISHFGIDGIAAAWVAEGDGIGGWKNPTQVSPAGAGWDTSVATRFVDGQARAAVSYSNYSTGEVEVAERPWNPQAVRVVGSGSLAEYTSVALDAFGEPLVTWRDYVLGVSMAAFGARWTPFGGGRAAPDPPVGRFEACAMAAGGLGTSLAPDRFGNWRLAHKRASDPPGPDQYDLIYLSRP